MRNNARPSWIPIPTLIAVLALVAAACGPAASPGASPRGGSPGAGSPAAGSPAAGSPGAGGDLIMLSTQLAPAAEQTAMRDVILADFAGDVEFVAATGAEFADRITAEATAGGTVSLLGGLHGDFAPYTANLTDLSDLASELSDRGFVEEYLELGKFDGDQQLYIPWMQATYIMAASEEAMEYLPEGADQNALTWQNITDWGKNIFDDTGERRLGFPAGEMGLWHRFFQGYGYPAFTGAVNTKFNSPEAVEFWEWLRDTWQYVNPAALNYDFMQEPLQSGEVWVAWDHVARLRAAFTANAEGFVAMPSPAGDAGRAFMPVIAGLAIPTSAPNPDAARDLIRHLTEPDVSSTTVKQVGFYPPTSADLPEGLDPGDQEMADAVAAQEGADDALRALLPIGLGDQGGAYNAVFRNAFTSIVINNEDIQATLDRETPNLQAILDSVEAKCWAPDPPSEGACQVE